MKKEHLTHVLFLIEILINIRLVISSVMIKTKEHVFPLQAIG